MIFKILKVIGDAIDAIDMRTYLSLCIIAILACILVLVFRVLGLDLQDTITNITNTMRDHIPDPRWETAFEI